MPDIYDRSKALAVRMLAPRSKGGKGLEMTLTRSVKGPRDPDSGAATAVITNYQGSAFRDTYDLADVDNTLIKSGDVKLLVSPVQLDGTDMPVPSTQDHILFDGKTYTIAGVSPWNYAGLSVGFEVQARA